MRRSGKKAGAGGADLMKRRGGVGDNGKSTACRIATHAGANATGGHVVKPGPAESVVKPSRTDSAEEVWIYVRGCRIKRAGLRFDSQGDVYVPDSEDDEDVAHEVAENGAIGEELAPAVAADRVTSIEMNPDVAARLAKEVLGEDLHPYVAAHLAEVLSNMEPLYHKLFIDMYKVMVPLFFTPP
jgi:hypothetical protein